MMLWRVSNYATLDGVGGMYASGRWHTRGQLVVYCSEDPSTALLETIVHMEIDAEDRPETFQVLKVEAEGAVSVERVEVERLGEGWPKNPAVTRALGDEWLRSGRSLLLEVSSVLVPERRNYLVNPGHGEWGQLKVVARYRHGFDVRLGR